jgi:hypothetical protein
MYELAGIDPDRRCGRPGCREASSSASEACPGPRGAEWIVISIGSGRPLIAEIFDCANVLDLV